VCCSPENLLKIIEQIKKQQHITRQKYMFFLINTEKGKKQLPYNLMHKNEFRAHYFGPYVIDKGQLYATYSKDSATYSEYKLIVNLFTVQRTQCI
jgi:hypothetical protein